MAVLAPVVGNPRREELLQAGQGARGEHLGAQRVLLQLLEIGLRDASSVRCVTTAAHWAHLPRDSLRARRPW